ncbi:hypothetical protein [Echinicola shivajiensis]|uniref:hypothetical protein n=1 Tax=Echinicola shivajiensis TaxID=1035916 RepID=UPI001BFBF808|nr:hypothetical protein [Echinicola shivajiensis]
MKKAVYFLFACFLVFAISCKDEEQPSASCGVENPAEDLAWMKPVIDELKSTEIGRDYGYIRSGNYEGNNYYYVGSCCPNCNWAPIFYNCEGEVQEDLEISDLTEVKLVWKSESNMCDF